MLTETIAKVLEEKSGELYKNSKRIRDTQALATIAGLNDYMIRAEGEAKRFEIVAEIFDVTAQMLRTRAVRQSATGFLREKSQQLAEETDNFKKMADAFGKKNHKEYSRYMERQAKNTRFGADLCEYLADMIQPRKDK